MAHGIQRATRERLTVSRAKRSLRACVEHEFLLNLPPAALSLTLIRSVSAVRPRRRRLRICSQSPSPSPSSPSSPPPFPPPPPSPPSPSPPPSPPPPSPPPPSLNRALTALTGARHAGRAARLHERTARAVPSAARGRAAQRCEAQAAARDDSRAGGARAHEPRAEHAGAARAS